MYKKKDFDACQFNPLTDRKLLEAYPRLSEIVLPEWSADGSLDNILRYVILVYDPKSLLVYNERDLNFRKGVAADLAGFDMQDTGFMEDIYNCAHPYITELIIRYLQRFCKSREWAAICALESAFWESIRKVIEPISGKNSKEELENVQKKSTIKCEINDDIQRLEGLYKKFLGEDEGLLQSANNRIRPESLSIAT